MQKKRKKSLEQDICNPCFNRSKLLLVFSFLVFIFHIIFTTSDIFSNYRTLIGNIFITALSFLALLGIFMVYLKTPSNFPMEKKGNLFLFLGLLLFFMGDFLWLYQEIFQGNLVPLGSFPDLAWNLGYIFLIISLRLFISFSFRPSNKWFYLLMILGIIVSFVVLYQDVSEDFEEGSFTFGHAIQDMYILYDFVLIVMIVYFIWPMIFLNNKWFFGWIIFGFGLFTRVIYDRLFADMTQKNTYYTGHSIDLLYVVLYLCVISFVTIKFSFMKKNG